MPGLLKMSAMPAYEVSFMNDVTEEERLSKDNDSIRYPMARGGGLFLLLIGTGMICAIVFSGRALVSYPIFYAGLGAATVSLFAAGRLSHGSPTRIQITALASAIALEIVLFIVMARTLPPGTPEEVRWLWVSIIVGVHFLPMALCFGARMLLLGLACIANGIAGLLMPQIRYELFGLADGSLKVACGVWLLVPDDRRAG
jgi:hypothetical protein